MYISKKRKKANINNIYRIVDNYTYGWHVKIKRSGTMYDKFFGDTRYGGKKNALGAARVYRDKLLLGFDGAADRYKDDLDKIFNRSIFVLNMDKKRGI